ncbi:MAG TPA: hypothetical protein VLY46_10805 [Usitatibacter sp.]|nr:hypothetical protein [Usitatibacter sp.]
MRNSLVPGIGALAATLAGPIDDRQAVTHIEDDAARVAGGSHVTPMV